MPTDLFSPAQSWNELPFTACFSQVLTVILLYSSANLKRLFCSYTACLEGSRWSVAAKALEKREEEGLTFHSVWALSRRSSANTEACLWGATNHPPAACPSALYRTSGALQWMASFWAAQSQPERSQMSGVSGQWSSMSRQSFQWPGQSDNHNNVRD